MQGLLFDGQLTPIAELDGTGAAIVGRFVYASKANVPDYVIRGTTTYRIVSDYLGSPRLVIDPSGTVVQRTDYDEFGNVLFENVALGFQRLPFGFAGGLSDSQTGLVRFGARDYDPVPGRWTAKDPIGFEGLDLNLFNYVFQDPVDLVDPQGTEAVGTLAGQLASVSIEGILENSIFIASAALAAHAVNSRLQCHEKYQDDKQWCLAKLVPGDPQFDSCLTWARQHFIRCINGAKRKPFPGYLQ